MRLKFEAKLNSMHSAYRELNTKNIRTEKDLIVAQKGREKSEQEVIALNAKLTESQKEIVSQKTQISNKDEKIQSQLRELEIKANQLVDFEKRTDKIQDELDLATYKL